MRLAYRPFFQTLRRFPAVKALVHTSGLLLDWWDAHAPDLLDLVGELVARGQVEPLTGGLTEPILPLLPDHDKVGQIQALTERVTRRLGTRPRGLWLAERVWEPHLARPLAEAGVEYVLVDDHHFGLAGLEPDRLSGYYLTEEQGRSVAVFPISQRLRYLIPFSPPGEVLAALQAQAASADALTMVDDGEKFGVWPETHRTVYTDGWLEAFFGGLGDLAGVELATASAYLDQHPPTARVYLPTASYREMGEWVLEPAAAERLHQAAGALARVAGPEATRLLRGGFWRNFLVRYPEVNDTYRAMLRLSFRIAAELARRPADARLLAARDALWRGQCNDAYWHGIFGGVYLPHLRRAVRSALLTAEVELEAATGERLGVAHEAGDLDGDGDTEVRLLSRDLALLIRPGQGGTLTEIAYRPLRLDLADVLTRRPERSHLSIAGTEAMAPETGAARTIHGPTRVKEAGLERLLAYDADRRASLQDYLLAPALSTEDAARVAWVAFPRQRFGMKVRARADGVTVELRAEALAGGTRLELEKTVRLWEEPARFDATYELRSDAPLDARLAVRWNLALTGPGPDRYLRTETGERVPLTTAAARPASAIELVDDWLGLTASLSWTSGEGGAPPRKTPGEAPVLPVVAWEPVYTVSASEAGLERIWQGLQVTVSWPVPLGPDPWRVRISLALASRQPLAPVRGERGPA